MTVRTPKYRHHKGSGQALVCIEGRRYYLGPHGTPESKKRFKRMVAEWLDRGTVQPPAHRKPVAPPDAMLLAEVCAAYKKFAEGYYRKAGGAVGQHLRHLRHARPDERRRWSIRRPAGR